VNADFPVSRRRLFLSGFIEGTMPTRTKPIPPATRLAPRLRRLFFLTGAEHRQLEKRFTQDMRKAQRQLDQAGLARKQRAAHGRDQLETIEQFGRRFLMALKAILDYYKSVFDQRRRPAHKGRPPGFKPKPPRRGTSGRPAIKSTPELQAWLSEIETLKEQREAQAMKSGYSAALRQHIFDYFEKKYLDDGRPRLEATRLATAKKTGPLFGSMKVKLSRLKTSRRR
jgi:hypothetical protein